jgi:hypothetical protein
MCGGSINSVWREAKFRVQYMIGLRNVGYEPKAEERYSRALSA